MIDKIEKSNNNGQIIIHLMFVKLFVDLRIFRY